MLFLKIKVTILFSLFTLTWCDVIVREVNSNEGTVCVFDDKTRGTCRFNCPEQEKTEYEQNVCSTNGTHTLYCCVSTKTKALYPTIADVCSKRRLGAEMYKRAFEENNALTKKLEDSYDAYYVHYRSVVRNCFQQALEREEDERSQFLEKCFKIPQHFGLPLITSPGYREHDNFRYVLGIGLMGIYNYTFWTCPGALIHESYVLTSGTCVRMIYIKTVLKLESFGVVRMVLSKLSERSFDYRIEKIFYHEKFKIRSAYNNLAILKVRQFEKRFHYVTPLPVCLWTESELPLETFTANVITNLSYVHYDIAIPHRWDAFKQPNEECEHSIPKPGNIELENLVQKNHFCVKIVSTDGDQLCASFEGAPLHIMEKSWLSVPYLLGTGSLQTYCTGNLTVFEWIYPHLQWIENIISGNH